MNSADIVNQMKKKPLVSIVIPVKNGATYLVETLNSVFEQSYTHLEIIVIDDNSSDHTVELLSAIKEMNSRLDYRINDSGKNGATVCRNMGFRMARGKYLIFLDADDLLKSNCIERRVAFFEKNQAYDFVVYQCELFDKTPGDMGIYWNYFSDENDLDRFIRVDTPWNTTSPLWKKQSIDTIHGWDENVVTWQDWDFHIRALATGLSYTKVPEVDFFYRKNVANSISKNDISEEKYLFFSWLVEKTYRVLQNADRLTLKRKRYLMGKLISLAILSFSRYDNWRLAASILLVARQLDGMPRLKIVRTLLISYLVANFDNKLVNKIAWLGIPDYYFCTSASKGIHQAKNLVL